MTVPRVESLYLENIDQSSKRKTLAQDAAGLMGILELAVVHIEDRTPTIKEVRNACANNVAFEEILTKLKSEKEELEKEKTMLTESAKSWPS